MESLTKDLLNKITFEKDWEQKKLTFKKDENSESVNLNQDNFIRELSLNIDSSQIPFLGDDEKNDAIKNLQNDRYNQLVELREKHKPTETENEDPDLNEENLKQIDNENDIKKLFSSLSKTNVMKAFNEAAAKQDLTKDQQKIISLTRQWLTNERKGKDSTSYKKITELQDLLNEKYDAKIKVDWMFGKDTFNAFVKAFSLEKEYQYVAQKSTYEKLITGDINKLSYDQVVAEIKKWINWNEWGRDYIILNWTKYRSFCYNFTWDWPWYRIVEDRVYIWEFKNGERDWEWIELFKSWHKYIWEYSNNKRHGRWTYTRNDGSKYSWNWENNEREWKWTLTRPNGKKFEWNRENGKKEWKWTITRKNGNKIEW